MMFDCCYFAIILSIGAFNLVDSAPSSSSSTTPHTSIVYTTPCKNWCSSFCTEACNSTLTTPICVGDLQCKCLCPEQPADCTANWCQNFCEKKAEGRKHLANCSEDRKICRCEFPAMQKTSVPIDKKPAKPDESSSPATTSENKEMSSVQHKTSAHSSKIHVGDDKIKVKEWHCDSAWCADYCGTKMSAGGTDLKSHCKPSQICTCEWHLPTKIASTSARTHLLEAPIKQRTTSKLAAHQAEAETSTSTTQNEHNDGSSSSSPSTSTKTSMQTTRAACKADWCENFCSTHVKIAIAHYAHPNYTATCDKTQTCNCKFSGIRPLGVEDTYEPKTPQKANNGATKKGKCTKEWCHTFCDTKAAGREYEARCEADETCKCVFPWKKTSSKMTSKTEMKTKH